MKLLLRYATCLAMVMVTLTLTACGGPSFDVTLENGSEVIIETDNIQITNQELFEMVATHTSGGLNVAVSTVLDWADYLILSEIVEIDEDLITEEMEMYQEILDDEELELLLTIEGYSDLDDLAAHTRLHLMRQQVVEEAVEITEEEVLEVYNEWFVPMDADLELDVDDNELEFEADEVDIDVPELDDVRDDIENWIREQAMQVPGFEPEVLANHRYEAGLVFHSDYLTMRYEDFLEARGIEVDVNPSSSHETAIATVGDHTLTVYELFDTVNARFVLTEQSPVLRYIDLQILDKIYDADRDQVRANISEAKVNMFEWFYPQMEMMGLTTEREIFDHFLFELLKELAFEANFEPDAARVQELYENYVPHRNVHHILVDTYEEAADLIAQLQAVDEVDFAELFADLALEHSSCGSAHDGGSLGPLTIPSGMVEAFEVAAFDLAEGEFTDTPVETEFGYHVIFVDEIEPPLTLNEHRENEMQRLRMNTQYINNYLIGLRAERHLNFLNGQLQAQYDAIVRQNEQLIEESTIDFDDDLFDDFEY